MPSISLFNIDIAPAFSLNSAILLKSVKDAIAAPLSIGAPDKVNPSKPPVTLAAGTFWNMSCLSISPLKTSIPFWANTVAPSKTNSDAVASKTSGAFFTI